jgi:hypothetical protein
MPKTKRKHSRRTASILSIFSRKNQIVPLAKSSEEIVKSIARVKPSQTTGFFEGLKNRFTRKNAKVGYEAASEMVLTKNPLISRGRSLSRGLSRGLSRSLSRSLSKGGRKK